MSKHTKKTGARKGPKLVLGNKGWLEEDQNGMEICSSDAKGWIVEDQMMAMAKQLPPKIFKLNIDCFDEVFEYLSLRDLHSFGQTCKTMLKVTGVYFKRNYSTAEMQIDSDGTSLPGFNQFFRNIYFHGYDQEPLEYMELHINEFEATRHLELLEHQVNERVCNAIGRIFPQLESIELKWVYVRENLYDIMLRHCTNLKRLHLYGLEYKFENLQEIPGSWINQKYPKLEYLELKQIESINGLNIFFDNNPNVRTFCTYAQNIWDNRNEILEFKAQLDLLVITDSHDIQRMNYMKQFCSLLAQLHKQGFYKRLHIITSIKIAINEISMHEFTSLNGLERICSNFPDERNMLKLEAVNIYYRRTMKAPVKQIHFVELSMDNAKHEHILPFVQYVPTLKTIQLKYSEGQYNILKLKTLNEAREKVFGARKITIYVRDEVFLKTKWNVENGNTNLRMIEMKRIGSSKWNGYN